MNFWLTDLAYLCLKSRHMRFSLMLFGLSTLLLSACVTSRKYDDLAAQKARLQQEYDALLVVRDQKSELENAHRFLQQDVVFCKQEVEHQKAVIQSMQQGRDDLTLRINDLVAQNQALLSASAEEKQSLVEEVLAKEAEIHRRTKAQDSLSTILTQREALLNRLEADVAVKEQKVEELSRILKEREQALQTLRSGLIEALRGYSAADLSVREANGRVYVSLSQNLLFTTGSDKLDPKGVKALQQLGAVLKQQKDLEILVEGHTDADGSADLNWDLSTARATSVVKILTREGVDAKTITAAGRAYFLPVAPNDSAEGKARNRRVEIILAPQLEKILQMIGAASAD